MEFWGVEVKSGEPFVVNPGEGKVLHLSQASLGEIKKDKVNESICIFVNIDGKKLVLGTLSPEKLPQQVFDLVFDKEFQLSHNWKNGSVYFYGYMANNTYDDGYPLHSEDDIPLHVENNGRQETQAKEVKPSAPPAANDVKVSGAGKQKVKIAEPKKDVKPEKDEDSEDSDDSPDSEDESGSDDPMSEDESDSEEDDESSEDDDEDSDEEDETPKKVESIKKRPNESATKTPGPDKKAKLVTPKKTDGKKGGGHVDTPHPSKKAEKSAGSKSNQQTPKSEGSHTCKPCKRSFKTEGALDSHTKAKHSTGK
ncbi:hypothetical protein LguiB_035047 [Lonicera macranthoides]